jgi:hypothetical protein
MAMYPAMAHLSSQMNVMWRMLVMALSALDRITASVEATSDVSSANYENAKAATDVALANSFLDGSFMDVQCSSIVDQLAPSLALADGQFVRVAYCCVPGHSA